jgi:hypothetical protein
VGITVGPLGYFFFVAVVVVLVFVCRFLCHPAVGAQSRAGCDTDGQNKPNGRTEEAQRDSKEDVVSLFNKFEIAAQKNVLAVALPTPLSNQ